MAIRVLNLQGDRAAAVAAAAVPDAEIFTYAADAVPDGVRAEVMFSGFTPSPVHSRLDEIGVEWMHISATGVDAWPRELLSGRIVTCGRGISAVPIADYVVAMMLAFEKDVPGIILDGPPKQWGVARLGELTGRTVGIVGLGSIGSEVAKRAAGFDCRVRALRRHPERGGPPGVEMATDLDDLLASTDHLVLSAPATAATRNLIDAASLAKVKPGVHLVNVARGELVDQDALRVALDDGRVAMASLDTVTPEPLPAGHWLYAHPKVRVTGHVSWAAPGAYARVFQTFADNLARYVAGEPLPGLVDPDEGY